MALVYAAKVGLGKETSMRLREWEVRALFECDVSDADSR